MNKKILLVSLLSVGMLVGCGGGDKPSSSSPSSETPSVSTSEGGSGSEWTGAFGNAGFYLVGEPNGWNNFWKFTGFEDFEFTKVSDTEYTLVYSVTEEFLASEDITGDNETGVDFKVMYWDGNKAPSEWYPDGVDNNGVITEPGEYKFTFNPSSTATGTKPNGESYTLYTTFEKIGEANPETAFVKGDARQFEPTFANVTFKVAVEEGLTIPENNAVYIHTWGLVDESGEDVSGYFELTESNGVWSYTTTAPITVDDGTDVGLTYEFCIIVDEKGKTEQDWNKKITNSLATSGNYSINVTKTKHSGTTQITKADKPYWTKGEVYNPYSVSEVYGLMSSEDYVEYTSYSVYGEVINVKYDSTYNSYTIDLKVETEEGVEPTYAFQIYSGQLADGVDTPEVGDTIVATGKSKIFEKDGQLPTYELAYSSSHKESPVISKVTKGELFYLYVRGSLTDWTCVPTHKLVETNTPKVYSVTLNIAVGDQFKLSNNTESWDVQYGGATAKAQLTIAEDVASCFNATGDNIECLTAGTYTFTYDLTGETPVASVSAA